MDYKKLNEVDIKESMGDSEHVLAVASSGDVVKIPKTAIQTQQILVIDCPDLSADNRGWTDDGAIETWVECDTLGGYTIDELKEIIKSGCVVRLKVESDVSGTNDDYSVKFYDVIGVGKVRNNSSYVTDFSDKETIVFSATFPLLFTFMDGQDNEIYHEAGYDSTIKMYQFYIRNLIWTGHELIIDHKNSPYNDEEEGEL